MKTTTVQEIKGLIDTYFINGLQPPQVTLEGLEEIAKHVEFRKAALEQALKGEK